jgi:bacterioferritin
MKGNDEVLKNLNNLLSAELTARDQYFVHSKMYENSGLHKLHERIHHEMEEETEHAARLIERMLFLEGTPDLSAREPLKVGRDVPEMLNNDLEMELSVINHLKEVIAHCESVGDYGTREILQGLLKDTEEDHTYWLEQQLGLIENIGLQDYLQSQM